MIEIKSGIEQLMFGEDLLSYLETIKWDSVLWMLFVIFSEKAKVIQMIKEGLRVIAKHHVVIAKEIFKSFFHRQRRRGRSRAKPCHPSPPRCAPPRRRRFCFPLELLWYFFWSPISWLFSSRLCKSFATAAAPPYKRWRLWHWLQAAAWSGSARVAVSLLLNDNNNEKRIWLKTWITKGLFFVSCTKLPWRQRRRQYG